MTTNDNTVAYRSHMIELPAGSFHYISWGEERTDLPPAVLVHGITSSSLSWVHVGPALADRYRVYAIDMRGHGKSVKPESGYTLNHTAGDIQSFIQALELRNPLLIGHSWGGATVLALASGAFTEQPVPAFSRVILEDPAVRMGHGDPLVHAQAYTKDIGRPAEELRREIIIQNPEWTPEDIEGKIEALQDVSREAVISVFKEAATGSLIPELRNIPARTLLLGADPQNGSVIHPRDWAEAAEILTPPSHALRIEGAPHGIHRTTFTQFMQAVDAFLGA